MGVYKRNGVFYVRFQMKGKKVNVSTGVKSKKKAEEYERDLKERMRKNALGLNQDMPFSEAVAMFIRFAECGRSKHEPSTITRYKTSLRMAAPHFSGLMVSDIDASWVKSYVQFRQSHDEVSNATIRRDLDALAAVFNYLEKTENLVTRNFIRDYDIGGIPEKNTPIRVPKINEIQQIINDVGPMLGRLMAFQALTGLRQQEALNLQWREVDLNSGVVVLPVTKTHSPRSVVLFEEAEKILRDLPRPPKGDYVFWHGDGERYKRFANQWQSFARRLDIPMRNHDLRHFFAKVYLKRGGSLHILMQQMGHRVYETTLQYAHLTTSEAEMERARMEGAGKRAKGEYVVKFTFPDSWRHKQQKHPGWKWKMRKE